MAYSAEISRNHPTCFMFAIDQSLSMGDPIGGETSGGGKRKADVVADAINRLLSELAIRCAKEEGVRDYFHVGVTGYGGSANSAFGGALIGQSLVPISDVANSPLRVEERTKQVGDGAGGVSSQNVKFPVWFDAEAEGGTPMCAALTDVYGAVQKWVSGHPDDFPPIVLNLTDGEATDGDPTGPGEQIKQLTTSDGNALLFNAHVSSTVAQPILFPDSEAGLPDDYARQLFRISSVLPGPMQQVARSMGYAVTDGSRGFVFNADIVAIVHFLDIGTRVDAQLR